MTTNIKATIYAYSLFFVIFFIIWLIIHNLFKDLSTAIVGALAAALTVFIAPHKQVVKAQSGKQIQLKWLFSKKVIKLK